MASKGQLTQKQAAEQLGSLSVHVRRLVARLRRMGDRAVIHGMRGLASNRRFEGKTEQRAISAVSKPECQDFGPTYAAEYVSRHLGIRVGKDRVRKWMIGAGLWRSRKGQCIEVHE